MQDLIDDLRAELGDTHIITDPDQATSYATDITGQWQGQALAVVRPANTEEVSAVVKRAGQAGVAIIPQGGNTGLTGACYAWPGRNHIILSLSRMNRIRDIRPEARIAIVEAGVVLEQLHEAADQHGLIYPMTFGAKGSCMIGGNLGTNAGGSNVVRYGNTRDLVLGIEAVLPNGDIVDLMSELHKDNTGYNLKHLLIGAEGTLGVITAAVLKLKPKPAAYVTAMVSVPDIPASLRLLNRLQEETGNAIEAYEYMPRRYFEVLCERFAETKPPIDPPAPHGIFLEAGLSRSDDVTLTPQGDIPGAQRMQQVLMEALERGDIEDAVICQSDAQRQQMWQNRERAYECTIAQGPSVDTDICLALDQVAVFLERLDAGLPRICETAKSMAVGHLGDGNLHVSIWPFPGEPTPIAPELYQQIMELVEEIVLELRGSFSAEHGIGMSKLPSMARRKDPASLVAMRAIKAALDPGDIMNPGKVLPAQA